MTGHSYMSRIALLATLALGSTALLAACGGERDMRVESAASCSSCALYDGTGWGGSSAYRPLDLAYEGALSAGPLVNPYVNAALASGLPITHPAPVDMGGIAVNDWTGVQRSAGEAPPEMALGRAPAYVPETAEEERMAWPKATVPAGYREVRAIGPGAGLARNGLNGFEGAVEFNNPSRELNQFKNRDMAGVGAVDTTPNDTSGRR